MALRTHLSLVIVVIALIIAALGIVSIYSSTQQKEGKLFKELYKRQLLWVMLGLFLFFMVSKANYRWFWDSTYLLYSLMLFFLFLVFVLGAVRLGAQRWLRVAWFNFQPSEFAKLIVVIFLARYFSRKSALDMSFVSNSAGILRSLFLPFLFVIIPMGLIIEQPDLGSGVIILLLFLAMLFLSQVRAKYLLILLSVMMVSMPVLWHFLRGYQKQRLLVFLNPNIDPMGAGYTVIQSKIAIGSGGIFGKGWLSGTQSQLRFLPEAHTDFIFATFSEEWGFVGAFVLLFLYYLLIQYGFSIARRTHDPFGKLLALGISCMLGIQIVVNIAMNLGLAPVVGVPLPLMSYGGSSMFVTFIALGILASIEKRRALF